MLLHQGDGPKDMFWELMEKFTHEERGLVLKFATGRIRYAVPYRHGPVAFTASKSF